MTMTTTTTTTPTTTTTATSSTSATAQVDLLDLAAAAISSAMIAADPIRQTVSQSVVEATIKVDGSFVTVADGAAQELIVHSIRKVSPHVRIVGEEIVENNSRIPATKDYNREAREELGSRLARSGGRAFPRCVDCSRVTVVIDPLDGTKHYIKGNYEMVTTLIGIIVDNEACFGVICKPFGYLCNDDFFETHEQWGDEKCFAIYGGNLIQGIYVARGDELSQPATRNQCMPKVIISSARSDQRMRQYIQILAQRGCVDPEPMFVGGAGEKCLRLLTGKENESLWFFPKTGTSVWDVAAGDALLRVWGGRISDQFGKDIDYSRSWEDAANRDGIVAANTESLHKSCLKVLEEREWGRI